MKKDKKIVYHGWIVRERSIGGPKDSYHAEWTEKKDGKEERHFSEVFYSSAKMIDWWDAKVGKPVRLLNTPLGAFRVYTEEE